MMDLMWTFLVVSSGKPSAQREARLRAEHGIRAGAGAVGLETAPLQNMLQEFQVLSHERTRNWVPGWIGKH